MFQVRKLRATQVENRAQCRVIDPSTVCSGSGLQQTECEVKYGTNVDRSQQETDTADKSPS